MDESWSSISFYYFLVAERKVRGTVKYPGRFYDVGGYQEGIEWVVQGENREPAQEGRWLAKVKTQNGCVAERARSREGEMKRERERKKASVAAMSLLAKVIM